MLHNEQIEYDLLCFRLVKECNKIRPLEYYRNDDKDINLNLGLNLHINAELKETILYRLDNLYFRDFSNFMTKYGCNQNLPQQSLLFNNFSSINDITKLFVDNSDNPELTQLGVLKLLHGFLSATFKCELAGFWFSCVD